MPSLDDSVPPTAQAVAEAQPGSGAQPPQLTADQRADIEQGVRRGLTDPNSATFGSMTARVSKFTSQSYIVCGWVKPGNSGGSDGDLPFVAMYVPKMRSALLIGMGGEESQTDAVRKRCIAEGVPLGV